MGTLQVTTTRNIVGGHGIPQCFVDWFCGGLQYQVDHHLFPMMPRHNLARAHVLVQSFCKEWGVTYHQTDLIDGTVEVLQHLSKVANEFGQLYMHEFAAEFLNDGPTMYHCQLVCKSNLCTAEPKVKTLNILM